MTYDDAGSGARADPHRHDRQEGCLDRPRDPLPTRVDLCPPLPPAYHHALDRGLRALDITLTPAARTAIDGHVRSGVFLSAATGRMQNSARDNSASRFVSQEKFKL